MTAAEKLDLRRGLLAGLSVVSPVILGLGLIYVMEVIEWLR